ncbi:hypothetical protein UMM65_12315 [Aureibaculum sp. 2210JD6-5]|uniref:hypothetical protein n=1 Tax=Aureibaculum sp. 2210JD6-5 TaxID=3103957 RepID=UPI002AAEA800|nr:hypothetical protein [Aureibaculum sp. 2210JD6-5]MDY7396031.1 hypothetical protein [Aureibaculum sp. 2210JD6-5]
MKLFYLTLIVLFSTFGGYSQELSEIEKKYDFVEVWGLENQSKKDFLTEIMSYPEGICQQSLTKMGMPDGNKIPIAFSNKIIVTTREMPKYDLPNKINKPNESKIRRWKEFKKQFDKFGFYERQQVPFFIPFFEKNNNKGVDSLYLKLQTEFKGYGIELNKDKIINAYKVYEDFSGKFDKQDALSVLYHSNEKDSLNEVAIFIAPKYLKNENDLLDFMPLLLEKGSGVQPILSSFINTYEGKINWSEHINMLVKLVNNPNPFQSVLALKIADRTGFTNENMKFLISEEMLTMKDILKSKNLPKEYIDYLIIFLNKYSDTTIEQNKNFWIKKLI